MLTILGGLAEFERELILARTSDGRTRAKARGSAAIRVCTGPSHGKNASRSRLGRRWMRFDTDQGGLDYRS